MAMSAMARLVALGAIRVIGYAVAIAGLAAGVAYLVVVAGGSPVWVAGVAGERGFQQLPLGLSLLYATAFLLGCLTVAGIALVVGDLAWRIRRGVTFAPAVSRSAWMLAAILALGSWITHVAQTIASQSAPIYPDDMNPAFVHLAELAVHWAVLPQSFLPDAPLLGLAVVLAVLAYTVRSGERLQRDVNGLA